jgi:hypothetical protein
MCGICTRGLTFKEYKQTKLLAISAKSPKLLITPPDKLFMKKITLVAVSELFTVEVIKEWQTNELFCEQAPGQEKINLYS